VNWLGDAVMSTPALLRLRERFPHAHITLLTPEKLRDLWLHHPALDEVITFQAGEGLLSVSRKLRAGNFDLALVLPNSPRSALEVWLANIPRRIGAARAWRNCFLTQLVAPHPGAVRMRKRSVAEINQLIARAASHPASSIQYPASAHHLYQYLHLVAALGANPEPIEPRLVVTDDEVAAAAKKFGLENIAANGRLLLALNPGAEYGPAKRWPVERFIAAAREIQQRTDCTWLILGGQADVALAEPIASAIRNLSGQTSLRELMALLKSCRVLLSNDTGPMHVAAALGTPVVVPFGSTSPELTGPGLPGDPRHRLLKSAAPCAPCFLRECPIDFRCMNGISVERVVEAVVNSLKR
jgi:heptosyltransferase-2